MRGQKTQGLGRACLVAVTLMAAVHAAACAPPEETYVDVRLFASDALAARAERLRLRVRDRDGRAVLEEARALGERELPLGVRVVPRGARADGAAYTIEAQLEAGATGIASLRVTSPLPEQGAAELSLWFEERCGACQPALSAREAGSCEGELPSARLFYVDPAAGEGAADCRTPARACATAAQALAAAAAEPGPVVVALRVGHRYPALSVARASTTLRGWREPGEEGEAVIEMGSGGTVVSAPDVGFEDLTFRASGETGLALRFESSAPDGVARRCRFEGGGGGAGSAILAVDASRVRVVQNELVDSGANAITVRPGGDAAVVAYNVVRDVRDRASHGINVLGDGVRIFGNRICRASAGLFVQADASETVAEHNSITGSVDAIRFDAATGGIRANLIAGNDDGIQGSGAPTIDDNFFAANTRDGQTGASASVAPDARVSGTEDCTLALLEGSPAVRGTGDGRDFGASGASALECD